MERILFYHGKTIDNVRFTIAGRIIVGNVRFTIAGRIIGDGLRLGLSLCSKRDQFCKKLGRIKAIGRSYSKRGSLLVYSIPMHIINDIEEINFKEIRNNILSNFEKFESSELKNRFKLK